mgnify:CR=1 FL=1
MASERKETKWAKLLRLMDKGQWVSMREMAATAGYRYGARLDDLKKQGWDHEIQVRAGDERFYRLFRRAPAGMQLSMNLSMTQEDART